MTETYRHTPDMGQISGFGGDGNPKGGDGYEGCCQDMLEAGVRWLVAEQAKRKVKLKMSVIPNVYGLLSADSADAKALEEAVIAGAKGEATGAMHHAVMMRLHYIAQKGWEPYCAEMRRLHRQSDEE